MSLDGKILGRAIERLSKRNKKHAADMLRLREEVYRKIPRIAQIDAKLSLALVDAASAALDGGADPEEAVRKVGIQNLALQAERAELMVEAGYSIDCIDEKPLCDICSDRGYIGSKPCECLMRLYKEEQRKELSATLKLGVETFDAFNLAYYSNIPEPDSKISARERMENIYEACLQYALKFNKNSPNLFFTGNPGLGKTFLSTCIAKEVSEKEFSVVYDTASSVFIKLEESKFSKSQDLEELHGEIIRYYQCDLLILDDLGTEMTTAFTVSALYDLINTRLTSGKQTIISSNLSIRDIRRRYSAQIASRLEGEYMNLVFDGKDIRLIKNKM
ncbi:MAG: ATP-binding protein [Clostridiales bacterium]|jgi:DNA replication protein DnaC|nr:ATP-binding protein [Clostridiales bacterium]